MNRISELLVTVCLTTFVTAAGLRAGEIHTAAAAGDLTKVRALIEADATLLESKDSDGNTPLVSACWGPPAIIPQAAVANYLIDKGASINARNTSGGSAVYFAIKDYDLTRRLIAKGADVNVHAYMGLTPLHQAASAGNLKVAKLLIDHGAELNQRTRWGSVLHALIIRERPDQEMAKLLLESGAKPQEFSFGNTELHLAAMKGYADLARLLVKHGAGVNAENQYHHTPLYLAARHGHRKTADALIAAGANKSAIVETNYGKAPQLTATLKDGEAYLWYLGSCSPCDGYAVKTKNHLLIFNPSAIDESPEAGLANGRLNPSELAGLKITVLMTHRPAPGPGLSVSELAQALPGAEFVLNFKPTAGGAGSSDIPPYRLATPNGSFSLGGIQVHAIPAMLRVFFESEGLGYLVEADGVKIFHPGFHVFRDRDTDIAKYRKEIDFLKPFGPIDIVFLPIKGRHISPGYEPYLYLLDQLSPKAVYLTGDDLVTEEYGKCLEVLRARDIPVAYPEGGVAVGERFHYRRSQAHVAQVAIGKPAAAAPRPALDVTYIANEAFLVRAAGKKVLLDAPTVAPPEAPRPEILRAITEGREPFNDLDLILITHQHADHFDPASLIACLRSSPKARLVAPAQVVNLLRPIDGFAGIEKQIQEIKGEAGAREQVSHNGITLDVLNLNHEHPPQVRNLAFAVHLGGTRFLHMGDAFISENEVHLKSYSFEQAPIDFLFLNQYDQSPATRRFIARTIKPSRIVAMHLSPAELAEAPDKIRAVYPQAIIFKESMEQRSLPIEVDFHNLTGAYFGQKPPGATPEVFALGIVSTDANEHSAPSFSPDGNEVFWWANWWPDEGPHMSMTMRREDGRWSAPHVSPFRLMPAFSPDGGRVYFYAPATRGSASGEGQAELDIWVAERQGDAWSEAKCLNLVARYPELRTAFMPRATRNGTLYFIAYADAKGPKYNSGIYRAELINGEYAKPELLPRSINLPPFLNWAPFIAPDESYLLFSSNRTGSLDQYGDLYISRRMAVGTWTDPVSLGEPVNTPNQEVFPGMSPDGKYLFFCRYTAGRKNDVYWVDAATIPALRSATDRSQESAK